MDMVRKPLSNNNLDRNRLVLIVDDEADLADLIAFNLAKAGYRTTIARDGRTALQRIADQVPDLLLLDLMLPEVSGTDIASRLRTNPATAKLPIIMLTAKADEVDQLVGLAVGADDYITKPFSMKVLLARIDALFRRAGETAPPEPGLRLGELHIDLDSHQVTAAAAPVHLTLTEFRLLATLVQAHGRVLSRRHLMARAMGPGVTVTERTIDVHMTAIRKKLGPCGHLIRTVRGVGYRAAAEPEGAEA
jgi:two-component system phosphate regulon response regulator PhoB